MLNISLKIEKYVNCQYVVVSKLIGESNIYFISIY